MTSKLAALGALALSLFVSIAIATPADDVDPFIGTGPGAVQGEAVPGGIGGATQPAAVVPFGMVQLGPDTDRPETSGYSYPNSAIRAFSLTHMSGPGCRNMGDVALMPFADESAPRGPIAFSHADEKASAGFYEVTLASGVRVELTATERTGVARFTFPASTIGKRVGFTIDVSRTGVGPTIGKIEFVNANALLGELSAGDFCNSKKMYPLSFAMVFDRDSVSRTFANGVAKISFVNDGRPLVLKTGISYVSKLGAANNLKESSKSTFDSVRAEARAKWDLALSTIEIETTDLKARRSFYTALYHSLLHPNIGSDTDGSYRGFDQAIHKNSSRPHYVNFSGWDVYRSQVQLLAFLFPERASHIVDSLVESGAQCGALPKWALNSVETNIMVGDPGALIVANMFAFGARGFDTKTALTLIKRSATDPRANCQGAPVRYGLAEYDAKGFIPNTPSLWGSAAFALEYAVADYGIAQFASALGDVKFAESMQQRSGNWRNIFDPSTGRIRPRMTDGSWLAPFDESSTTGFVEGNSAQYTWMIPHDVSKLISMMGGDAVAIQRLDDFMSKTNAGQKSPYLYLGNEPSFGVPWLYLWAHAPSKTQKAVRDLLANDFGVGPSGLTGNDDLGALSSWAVWASLGLFPAIPGRGVLVIGSPAFSKIVIKPVGRPSLTITAPGAETEVYVAALGRDGQAWDRAWMDAAEWTQSRELTFTMDAAPRAWGSQSGAEPPSLGH